MSETASCVGKMAWEFPIPGPHSGMPLGNSLLGLLVWGEDDTLRITVGRADFWDHRGGMEFTEKHSYQGIRKLLEDKDEAGLRQLFYQPPAEKGTPERPSLLPVGRVDFKLEKGATLKVGELNLRNGSATVKYSRGGADFSAVVQVTMSAPAALVEFDADKPPKPEVVPAWKYVGEELEKISFRPPARVRTKDFSGFVQPRPAPGDGPLCLLAGRKNNEFSICAHIGRDEDDALDGAKRLAGRTLAKGAKKLRAENKAWWGKYWTDAPRVDIPNRTLSETYHLGMFKFAAMSNPDGVPAGLQGPWLEEHRLPPWSGDYHFNINVQMCYAPAYQCNRLSHLRPLFDMIWGWRDKLRHNAKMLTGADDGLMLPHAVDDRGVCMGGFWSGSIDHACTGWVAKMMYDYCVFAPDHEYLRDVAFPFMKGAMRVYERMLEDKGGRLSLPVSVSPEYKGADMDAWGRNASFQLACVHMLCRDLVAASRTLGVRPDPAWENIRQRLPQASVFDDGTRRTIGLWDGTELGESHRHHSHLAGIWPFETLNPSAPEWRDVIAGALDQWTEKGAGLWTGWCVPWAAIIHAKMGNGEMAEMLLEIWRRLFTNEGFGSLHDARIPGFTIFGAKYSDRFFRGEIMQLDGSMQAVGAVTQMLLSETDGVVRIFPAVPRSWKDASFDGILCRGGFLAGAKRSGGKTSEITIEAKADGRMALENPWGVNARCQGAKAKVGKRHIEIALRKGERARITPSRNP